MRTMIGLLSLLGSLVVASPAYARPEAELRKLVETQMAWMQTEGIDASLEDWFSGGGDGFFVLWYGDESGPIQPAISPP